MKPPQLSLRELFLWVAVVALLCAWWFQRGQIAEAQRGEAEAHAKAEEQQALAERVGKDQQLIIDAYRRDGRLHDVRRADGSVFVTDEKQPIRGFGPAGQ